ncbi:MAG TPA: type IV pilus secretin PilQ [Gammaproteobacteria bacterium]|nr:type IV pilus secretin PilQ [Gammaproteobacteria bacterium]
MKEYAAISKLCLNRISKPLLIMVLFALPLVTGIVCAETTEEISAAVNEAKVDNNKYLSFYFQNIEVRSLLQLIAKSSGLNFIISESVKGNVTLNLKNVTWQQALAVILKTQGLTSRQVGNVMFIGTIEEITSNETKLLQSEDAIANILPLQSALVSLKYATAKDIADVIKGQGTNLLSSRGQVAVDSRTNSLIIRDTKENIRGILPEIKKLDVPAKQVLIEARIVNIDIAYEEQLGVRFGTSNTRSLSGTLSGANQLAQGINVANVTPLTDRLNFNVPASAIFDNSTPGSIGLALAHLGDVYLDLELSALEGERHAKVIARPRVVTSNQQKATIQTGEEIPYQESSSSGATTVSFKKAVLSLEIVPQITPDNKIVLSMKATQDSRGTNTAIGATAGGTPITIPAINTQEVQSNVLLNDNETIVIGGVYREVKINTWDRIPFFGTLPMIGNLFSHKGVSNEKHELLIFVTPKIITARSKYAESKGEGSGEG